MAVDDLPGGAFVVATALLLPRLTETDLAARRAYWDDTRGFVACDDARIVGIVRALALETSVPGGARVPTAGVSGVGVLPTHTRRGLLRALMQTQLEDEAARGTVLASLRASEAAIYGRFGYGLGGFFADHCVERSAGALVATAPGDVSRVRVLHPDDARSVLPAVYERACQWRVGAVGRFAGWWDNLLGPLTADGGNRSRWIAVHDGPDGPDGYVDYQLEGTRAVHHPDIAVTDLFAATDDGYGALWKFLLGIDLVGTVRARRRPIDEPLRWWLADARALVQSDLTDEQWIRLIDADAAYRARTYAAGGDTVVIGLSDAQLPHNTGRYRISPDGAERTDDRPDLSLGTAEAGATYLGGTSFQDLRDAGRIVEDTPGAAARADRLFAVRPLPWCGTFF